MKIRNKYIISFIFFVTEGDNDSGVDESTQGNVSSMFSSVSKLHGSTEIPDRISFTSSKTSRYNPFFLKLIVVENYIVYLKFIFFYKCCHIHTLFMAPMKGV